MSRLQTWDDQVKAERCKSAPVQVQAPTDPAVLALLERIARATERTSRRTGIIEWLMLVPVVMTAAILVLGYLYR